jgi:hypothetical protein
VLVGVIVGVGVDEGMTFTTFGVAVLVGSVPVGGAASDLFWQLVSNKQTTKTIGNKKRAINIASMLSG